MFDDSELRELISISSTHPVLSVYLNMDPTLGNPDKFRLRLRNMLKDVTLVQDVAAVERFFRDEFDWSGRGVVVFSCAGEGWLRSYKLAMPVRDLVQACSKPVVKPVANLLDNYGGYGVVLVDKQGARVFSFHLGELVEEEWEVGKQVRQTKRDGVAGTTDFMDEVIERNMRGAVEFATRFFEKKHIRRVVIGGTDENVAQFRGMLPHSWQSLVMGTFPMSMTATHGEVMKKAMEVGLAAEREREARLLQRLQTKAAKGEGAVIGLEQTLEAVNNDRVDLLVVRYGFHQPGRRCSNCEALLLGDSRTCPVCGGSTAPIQDVVDPAVSRVLTRGGEVEVTGASPALDTMSEIGAVLRY